MPLYTGSAGGRGPFAGVSLHTLLTGVRTGDLDLAAQALLLVTVVAYGWGMVRLRRRGRRWPWPRVAAFAAGMLSLWIAVGSGVAAYDEGDATIHMVQHLLLMMVAPPLLALGRPLLLAIQAGARHTQLRVTRILHSRAVAGLTHPFVAWSVYLGVMYLLIPDRTVYRYVVAHPLVHDGTHVVLVAAGLLYWQPLLSPETAHQRRSYPALVVSVLANMPFEAVIGLWLRYQSTPIDPLNNLADTQTAGEAFLVGASILSTVWLSVIVIRWLASMVREERRQEARDHLQQGWTTPWWVTSSAADP